MNRMEDRNESTQLAQIILEIVKALPAVLQALPPIQVQVEMISASDLQRIRDETAAEIQTVKGSIKTISARQDAQHRTLYDLMSVLRQK